LGCCAAHVNPGEPNHSRMDVDREDTARMTGTTTVKVQTSTRDLLLELGAARRQSVDGVILAALAATKRDERRQVAAADARAIRGDPADLAEIHAIQQDMAALHQR
jgi:hypothetical protein